MQDDKVSELVMETTPKITIEELAVKLNGKMWVKEDLKRIYLDRGYNTKKMSTKTYVQQSAAGVFYAKCFIDCPSQNDNWIESQQDQIIESVEQEIEEIIELSKVELIESRLSEDETEVEVKISYNGNVEDNFLTETQFDQRFNKYPQSVFENLPETKKVEKAPNALVSKHEPQIEKVKVTLGEGKKVKHARFGLGEIIEEFMDGDNKKFKILFETDGEKLLLERFANLTFL